MIQELRTLKCEILSKEVEGNLWDKLKHKFSKIKKYTFTARLQLNCNLWPGHLLFFSDNTKAVVNKVEGDVVEVKTIKPVESFNPKKFIILSKKWQTLN